MILGVKIVTIKNVSKKQRSYIEDTDTCFSSKLLILYRRMPFLFKEFLNQNIGCGYSKEPSQEDVSFVFKQMDKKMKIITILSL